jgi:hypothetical protein
MEDAHGDFTGREALYFDSTTTVGIDRMDEASGSVLLVFGFVQKIRFCPYCLPGEGQAKAGIHVSHGHRPSPV